MPKGKTFIKNKKKEEIETSESSSSNSVKNFNNKDDEVSDLQNSLSESEEHDEDSGDESGSGSDNEKGSDNSGKNFISNEFKEKVLAFIKIDDIIRKKNEEVKELKDKKKECEEYILRYLDKADAGFVNVQGGKLIKNQSESKAPLKVEIIKESIVEGIKSEKIINDDEKFAKIVNDIMDLMDAKRGKTIRTNIKRTFEREKKTKKNNKNNNNNKDNNKKK